MNPPFPPAPSGEPTLNKPSKDTTDMNSNPNAPLVLIVDDAATNLELLSSILGSRGYRVQTCSTGAMALRFVASVKPDIVLLDVMMPDMDGFEVCHALKEDPSLRDVPVVFISALDDVASKVRAFAEGGVDYVTKPFRKEEVLARVKTNVERYRQQIEIAAQREELQRNLEQLRQLESQRDQLVHMIVHDMRSPLMGILGYAELLSGELLEKQLDELAGFAASIGSSGHHLRDMISTLLDISRMESNEMPIAPACCDVRSVVAAAIESLGALVQNSSVSYSPPPHETVAFCDPEITRRIVQNLAANAIKFTGDAGEVHLEILETPEAVRIAVRDTGPGIPPEFHGRIFEKFGQANASPGAKRHSTGLGLTFCKLAAEAQGGRIGLESQVGSGSTFWFTLPLPQGSIGN
jgi:two-component system, sensor histidine kinase and response regulator